MIENHVSLKEYLYVEHDQIRLSWFANKYMIMRLLSIKIIKDIQELLLLVNTSPFICFFQQNNFLSVKIM